MGAAMGCNVPSAIRVLLKPEPSTGLWVVICLDYKFVTQAKSQEGCEAAFLRALGVCAKASTAAPPLPERFEREYESGRLLKQLAHDEQVAELRTAV
jgi:hypothetical protein